MFMRCSREFHVRARMCDVSTYNLMNNVHGVQCVVCTAYIVHCIYINVTQNTFVLSIDFLIIGKTC